MNDIEANRIINDLQLKATHDYEHGRQRGMMELVTLTQRLEAENKRLRKLSADFYKALIRSDNNMLEAVSYSIWEETQMDIQRLGARLKKEGV